MSEHYQSCQWRSPEQNRHLTDRSLAGTKPALNRQVTLGWETGMKPSWPLLSHKFRRVKVCENSFVPCNYFENGKSDIYLLK